jgi:ribosomal protein S18 acetylase RimI-like enzyme
MVSIRQMSPEELTRVEEIDVSESSDLVYYYIGGKIATRREARHRSPRNTEAWGNYIEQWKAALERGGATLGAFDEKRLVGIAVLQYHLTERMAHLVALFVSKDYRRQGIASQLTQEIMRLAKAHRASEIYVSATPSESAIGFYRSQRFVLAQQVHKDLYALEPEDIHLIRQL